MRQTMSRIHRSLQVAVMFLLLAGLLTACEDAVVAPTPLLPVASVSVVPIAGPVGGALNVGDTVRLAARPYAANGTELTGRVVEWASSNADVATISPSGLLTARAPGSVRIAAEVENKIGEHWVHVATGPAQIVAVHVTPLAAVLEVGETKQYSAIAVDAAGNPVNGHDITWIAEPAERVSITASGLVTALAPGYAQVRAAIAGVAGTVALTVATPEPVHAIHLQPAAGAVEVNSYIQLHATPLDRHGNALDRDVTWSSGNSGIAMVGTDGLVLGVAPGAVLITATSGGISSSARIEVRRQPSWPIDTYTLAGTTSLRVPYIEIGTTTWNDNNGEQHDAFLVVRGGTFKLNLMNGTYEQSLEVATYRLNGQPGAAPVRVQNVTDRGDLMYDLFTGYYIFQSRTRPGTWFKVTSWGGGEFVAPQSVLGKQPQQWVWVRE